MADAVVMGSGEGAALMRSILAEQQKRLDDAVRILVVEEDEQSGKLQRPGHRFGHLEMHTARVVLFLDGDEWVVLKSAQHEDLLPGDRWRP